ncbi:MAG TPA: helix-hairpin-helix domain-containing protein [Jatrophihabitans sp.]|nr:helix-hairpin-helix domain-containing protein [Jatrophihabitans sp.]
MRDDSTQLRGESGRIAARVRELVDDVSTDAADVRPDPPAHRPSWGNRLAALLPVRVDPGRRAPVAVGVAVLLAAVLTGLWVLSAKPRAVALSASGPVTAGTTGAAASGSALVSAFPAVGSAAPAAAPTVSAAATASDVVVDVAGRVRRPGLYRLPAGSRVDDAITAAGGARRGVRLTNLNLAAPLVDGEQVLVGPGAGSGVVAPAVVPAPAAGSSTASAPVALNTATLEQLETLPGVGPVTAQKILDYRAAHGSFSAVDQLKDVSGIGDVTFAELQPLVTL